MAGLWQRTGNVTVTNGSKTLTGFGTKWKTGTLPIQKGHTFYGPDNAAYEVDTVVSDENILLVDAYRGGTLANQPYRIDITRTSTISQFAADLASLVAKYRTWFDGMMTWLTGSGDVAILNPDTGANVTIPSWKKVASEGEGQAARAKTEADKAAGSAAAAEATVRDAALPLPDVWAPLVDSLRLITGKGRDVKVGEDVVARTWQFERLSAATERQKDGKLRLVPAGEPRYEGGCLVKERGSTNLSFPHDGSVSTATRGTVEVTAGTGLLGEVTTTKFREDMEFGGHYLNLRSLSGFTVGDDVSITVELVPLRVGMDSIRLGSNDMTVNGTVVNITPEQIGKPLQIVHRSTMTTTVLRSFVWGYVGAASAWQGNGSLNFEILSVQVEKGPPTSLIPTTTAAATRAPESIWLPGPANNPGYGKSRTYAVEFEVISPSQAGYTPIFCDGAYPTRTFVGVWSDGNLMANNDYVKAYTTQFSLKKRNVIAATFDYDGGNVSYSLNGGAVVKSSTPCVVKPGQAETPYERFEIGALGGGGHQPSIRIRNFRCWHRAVSEAQLRAIR